MLAMIAAALQFTSPFLIYEIIAYVESQNQDIRLGIYLIIGVGVSRLLLAISAVQDDFLFVIANN